MDTAVSMLKDHQLWLSSGGKEGKQAVFTGYDLSGLDSDYAEAYKAARTLAPFRKIFDT
ncbi:hypothetical protein ACI43T_00820 [Neisseria oralis]|uniref:Uncharacterized protein n=1 Tax=Neisseria oralis TaxID=1107316 RepID=A0ABW8Q1G1_9NEIS